MSNEDPRGVLYGQDTVDALRTRIATLEALLRRWHATMNETGVPVRLIEDTDATLGDAK